MKILLINPPSQQLLIGNNPDFIDEQRGFNPPLGLLYLAAAIVKDTKHEVNVLDALAEEMGYEDLHRHVIELSEKNKIPKHNFLGDGLSQYKRPQLSRDN